MGISAQQMLQNDPDYLARQAARQEIQQYQNFQNPQLGLAATSGALIGRGLANLYQGRGFFETSDPALRKVSEIQTLYNNAMQSFDPMDPSKSYATLATTLAQRGYGREAALAAAEANKFIGQGEDRNLKRQEIEARIRSTEAQAEATKETAAQRAAAAEEARNKITTIGTTTKRLTTYRKGTEPQIYVMNEKGEEEKYKPSIHGGYEVAEDRRTPPAARPVYQRDAFQNVYQMNPDGTKTLVIPGLVPPGQAAPGAAPAPKNGVRTVDQLLQDLSKAK